MKARGRMEIQGKKIILTMGIVPAFQHYAVKKPWRTSGGSGRSFDYRVAAPMTRRQPDIN
jgi:hypothetical protein